MQNTHQNCNHNNNNTNFLYPFLFGTILGIVVVGLVNDRNVIYTTPSGRNPVPPPDPNTGIYQDNTFNAGSYQPNGYKNPNY